MNADREAEKEREEARKKAMGGFGMGMGMGEKPESFNTAAKPEPSAKNDKEDPDHSPAIVGKIVGAPDKNSSLLEEKGENERDQD